MAINFTCPHCAHRTNVSDEYAGHSGPCAECGKTITVPPAAPPAASEGRHCPHCRAPLALNAVGCTQCGTRFSSSERLGDNAGIRMLMPVGRSIWAIIAGYLGLFAVLVIPAPFAIIVGVIAIVDICRHPEKHGMGRAIFGIVMGVIGCLLIPALIVFSI